MIFYRFRNSSAYRAEKDERIRDFLHFIQTNEPDKDDFSNRLSTLVEKIKDNEKFRMEYAAMNLHDWDITRAAKKEGREEKAIEDAVMLVHKYHATPEAAAQDMNIPLELVLQKLKNQK